MDIAEKRWKTTDRILEQFQSTQIELTDELKEELLDFLKTLNITQQDLNKPITEREKHRLNKLIKDSWETIADNDYLSYRVQTRKRNMTFSEYIALMLLLICCNYTVSTFDELKDVFMGVARDAKQQATEEIGREPKKPYKVTWGKVKEYLDVPSAGMDLLEYLVLLAILSTEDIYNLFLLLLNPTIQIGQKLDTLLDKFRKRIINIHDGKESGVVVDTARDVWHDVYLEPYKNENAMVRFIAERDEKTTMMCRGLDNMYFYTNNWNRYYRWSELDQRDVLYTTFGLVRGENLPPIDNHFHWCRSTITYIVDDWITNGDRRGLYLDVTEDYLRAHKNRNGQILQSYNFIQRGQEFTEDGKDVTAKKLKNEQNEQNTLEWYKDTFGGKIYKVPRIANKEIISDKNDTGKTPDAFIDGLRFDVKNPTGSGVSLIRRQVQGHEKQAENFIIEIMDQNISHEEILKQVNSTFVNESWVQMLIIKQGNWFKVFERNKK